MKRTDTKHIRAGREKILEAGKLTHGQARLLIANYYMAQELRKRGDMQLRHLGDKDDPVTMLDYFSECQASIESDIQRSLEVFARGDPVGRWMLLIDGIGPVVSAGILAHIDIERAPTSGHVWRFAGLDRSIEWISREAADRLIGSVLTKQDINKPNATTMELVCEQTNRKVANLLRFATTDHNGYPIPLTRSSLAKALSRRPHNPALKQICFHAGESFKRRSTDPSASIYSQLYRSRKARVVSRNEHGDYAERAKTFKTRSSVVRSLLEDGKLPAGNLDKQACDFAVKVFLSHAHAVMYWSHYGVPPPKPFALSILGHAHEIKIPNLDAFPGLENAYYGLAEAAE